MLLAPFSIELSSTFIENILDLYALHPHVLRSNPAPAYGADVVVIEPPQDAVSVERVPHVAAERSDLVSIFEVSEADGAVTDAPEATLVIGYFRGGVDHILTSVLLGVSLAMVGVSAVDDARTEDNEHCDDTHNYESLREDEADDYSEDEKTEAWIRVVTMGRKALERSQNVNRPDCVQHARGSLDEKVSLVVGLAVVCDPKQLENDSHDGLSYDDQVEKDHVELCRLEVAAVVHLRDSENIDHDASRKTTQLHKFVSVVLFEQLYGVHTR